MKEQWVQWSEKFAALTQREKIIIAAASLFLFVYVGFTFVLSPQMAQIKENKEKMVKQAGLLATTNNQLLSIKLDLEKDPNVQLKKDIRRLNKQIDRVNKQLEKVLTDYVLPENMPVQLTSLLKTSNKVRVIAVTAEQPSIVDIIGQQETPTAITLPEYYRHQFTVTLQGEYFPLMAFVEKVVARNQKFRVDDLMYEVAEYPVARMTLSLVTISDNENVIRL